MPDGEREVAKKIVEAALALWSEKGYVQSTMRELARRIGMGVSSLYFYFSSKEQIVQYIYRMLMEQAHEQFRASDKGEKDLGKNFKRFLDIKLALLKPHRSALAVILREAVDPESRLNPMSPDSANVLESNLKFLRELVGRARFGRPEEQESMARLLWLIHLAVLMYWLHDRSPEFKSTSLLLEKLVQLPKIFPMLRALPGASDWLQLIAAIAQPPSEATTPSTSRSADVTAAVKEADVVVIGAGPIGTVYASFLKQRRPQTRILILERSVEPGHKIGESTLSGFCKALRTVGIRQETMRTLFYPKNGLAFLHLTETVRDITKATEYILETFDQTFQVERRVLDSLLIANVQRLGVRVIQGAKVDLDQSQLSEQGNVLVYAVGSQVHRVKCSLVVDASGPAGLLSNKFSLRTDEGIPFQTSSTWTYYAGIRPLATYPGWPRRAQFPRDQYTVHLTFREGWLWYIPLVSWQSAPTANLSRAFDYLLRTARATPSRQELSEEYGCPTAEIVSVGITLRSDRNPYLKDDPRATFDYYSKKYPAVAQVLRGGKILEHYYGDDNTYMFRLTYRSYARRAAGDGWLLVGDAAFFVDPLISPGLTGGVAGAFQAMLSTVNALDAGRYTADSFTEYQAFIHDLHEVLERDNQLVYMSFNHPEALALIQRFQEIDARRHFLAHKGQDYSVEDTNVWGILDPTYQKVQKAAWSMMREEEERVGRELSIDEQSPREYERMVQRLKELLGSYVNQHQDLTPYAKANA